jgi:hypothetical protein
MMKKIVNLAKEKAKRAPRQPRRARFNMNHLMAINVASKGERSSPFVSRATIAKAKIIIDFLPEAIPTLGFGPSFEAIYREAASRKRKAAIRVV